MARDGSKVVRTAPGQEREIDRRVGARIRERRITLGLTQKRMAEQIGITYQQANKYEMGINVRQRFGSMTSLRCSVWT